MEVGGKRGDSNFEGKGTRGAKGAPKCFPLNRLLLLFLPTDSLGRLSQPAIERTIGSPAATAAAAAAAAPAGRSRLDRLDDPAKEGRKEGRKEGSFRREPYFSGSQR